MITDNMSAYSGLATIYSELPLSALRELESILKVEIESRLESFGVKSMPNSGDNVVGSVADVEKENVVAKVGNNVIIGNFGRGNVR